MCPFKQRNLGASTLLAPHTHLWVTLFVFSKLFALHRHGHTYWLGLYKYKRFSSTVLVRFHTTPSRWSQVRFFAFVPRVACEPGSRRTKSLETVARRVVTGISHWIILFCERNKDKSSSWDIYVTCDDVRVVGMLMLRVMTYVVSYQMFWNWTGVVRFVFHVDCTGAQQSYQTKNVKIERTPKKFNWRLGNREIVAVSCGGVGARALWRILPLCSRNTERWTSLSHTMRTA